MSIWSEIKSSVLLRLVIGAVIGGIGGYLYYYFIGCKTNSCPITSNPYYTVLWGVLLGVILFFPEKKKSNKKQDTQ